MKVKKQDQKMPETEKRPYAVIRTSRAEIRVDLYPEYAPNTVASFIYCVRQGWYKHQKIRRIVPGYVIQPSYNAFDIPEANFDILAECAINGIENPLEYHLGTVAMGGYWNLASGSEFFFTMGEDTEGKLTGKYPPFGLVTKGIEELRRLENVKTAPVPVDTPGIVIQEPVEPEYIEDVIVETFGRVFPDPVVYHGPIPPEGFGD
ncbi:MAG: peptidylprolyl isomerase [Firmicutes bacterium]|nr:peptidylprolyl isomerase [Bacillota bacterium]